jgi:hypothetical protein
MPSISALLFARRVAAAERGRDLPERRQMSDRPIPARKYYYLAAIFA